VVAAKRVADDIADCVRPAISQRPQCRARSHVKIRYRLTRQIRPAFRKRRAHRIALAKSNPMHGLAELGAVTLVEWGDRPTF